MRILNAMAIIIFSICLKIILLVPRLIVLVFKIAEGILRVCRKTIDYLIELVEEETRTHGREKRVE